MRKSQERSRRVTVFPSAYEAGSLGIPAANNVTERSRYFARNTSASAQSFRWKVSFEAVLGSINLAADNNLPGAQRPSFADARTG
jgi:N-acyl-L-homoserine lactone synthetase